MKRPTEQQGFSHIIVLVLIVVLLGGIGFAGWQVYKHQKKSTSTSTVSSQSSNSTGSSSLDASGMIAAIKTGLAAKYTIVSPSGASPMASTQDIRVDDSSVPGPSKKISSDSFFSYASSTVGLDIYYYSGSDGAGTPDEATASAINQLIAKQFMSNGLTKITDSSLIVPANTDAYSSSNLICNITQDQLPQTVSCSNQSDFPTSTAAYQPFAKAFLATNSTPEANVFADLKISDSQTAGYKVASMNVIYSDDGNKAEFYQKGDGLWQFFGFDGQSPFGCSQFATNSDAKLAFKGKTCLNDDGSSSTL